MMKKIYSPQVLKQSTLTPMSSSLHPYYLQQMGIPLWELRLSTDTPIGCIPKLVILIEEALEEGREKSLFRQMLFSIGLREGDIQLLVLPTESSVLPSEILKSARIIMTLGYKAAEWYRNNKEIQTIPCVVSSSPKHLLLHGQDKKKAYKDWLQVKDHLLAL